MKYTTNLADHKSRIDRLGVGVTGCDIDQILGYVKVLFDTAGDTLILASAAFQLLSLWEVKGACILLQQLKKERRAVRP